MKQKYTVALRCTYEGFMTAVIDAESEEEALDMLEKHLQEQPSTIINKWLLLTETKVMSVDVQA